MCFVVKIVLTLANSRASSVSENLSIILTIQKLAPTHLDLNTSNLHQENYLHEHQQVIQGGVRKGMFDSMCGLVVNLTLVSEY